MKTGQRGVAVVLAMGVVALASIVATAIVTSQGIWVRQSQLAHDYVQAQAMVKAGVDWVRAVLSDDSRMGSIDHLGEPWALQMPAMPIENGELTGHIHDQQGLFNLNNLAPDGKISAIQLAYFKRLLALLDLPDSLADTLVDWIDVDSVPRPQHGAEDEYYLVLNPSYLTANRPLTDVAELAHVRGFNRDIRARLRPFVTALPSFTTVNVNTAPPEVLAAIVEGLGIGNARILTTQRERAYFRDHADFLNRLPDGVTVEESDIGTSSNYFLATLSVAIGEAHAGGLVLLNREEAAWPAIVWRKYS
jgi:general secretion pathway protein K